jgi:hypothetical protein
MPPRSILDPEPLKRCRVLSLARQVEELVRVFGSGRAACPLAPIQFSFQVVDLIVHKEDVFCCDGVFLKVHFIL